MLDTAQEVNLKFNAKKCRIRQEEVPYVGHFLSKDCLKLDPEIQAVPPPPPTPLTTLRNLRHSMDSFNFLESITKRIAREEHYLALGPRARSKLSETQGDGLVNTSAWIL